MTTHVCSLQSSRPKALDEADCDIEMATVDALIRSDGEKKACVPWAPDWDAVAVATKVTSTESNWLTLNLLKK